MVSGAPAMITGASAMIAREPTKKPADPAAGPGDPPPQYASLDPRVRDLLWRSRDTYDVLHNASTPEEFWKALDGISGADLQAAVQVLKQVEVAGLTGIDKVRKIYNYGSSWGLDYNGAPPPVGAPAWGYDFPQDKVRAEHGGAAIDWNRQNTGAGNSGLHAGVDAGAGYHNLHIDPTNPMKGVSDGIFPAYWIPNPLPPWIPVPVILPKGYAIYDALALIQHAQDIGKLPGGDPHAGDKWASQPYLDIKILGNDFKDKAGVFASIETDTMNDFSDKSRASSVIGALQAAANAANQLNLDMRPVAMQDNDAHQADVAVFTSRLQTTKTQMFQALAACFSHLHDEAPTVNMSGADSVGTWSMNIGFLHGTAYAAAVAAQKAIRDKKAKAAALKADGGDDGGHPPEDPPDGGAPGGAEIARAEDGPAPDHVPEAVKTAVANEQGTPLADAEYWSARVDARVNHARIVDNAAAAEASASINARAFTVGNRVFLGAGQSPSGELLRHELTHVAQQHGAEPTSVDSLRITDPQGAHEQEARAGGEVDAGGGHTEIARDELPKVRAQEWVKQFAPQLQADITGQMNQVALETGMTGVTWSRSVQTVITAIIGPLLADGDMFTALDQAIRSTGGSMAAIVSKSAPPAVDVPPNSSPITFKPEYKAEVALEIRNALAPALLDSVKRVMPRYTQARYQALVKAQGTNQQSIAVAPEPSPDEVLASQPLDKRTIQAVTAGTVAIDMDAWQKAYPDLMAGGSQKLQTVTFTFDADGKFVTVSSPAQPRKEDISKALYGDETRGDSIVPAPPKFGFEPHALTDANKTAFQSATGKDANASVGGSPYDFVGNDDVALAQSNKLPATGASRDEIVDRIGRCKELAKGCATDAAAIGQWALEGVATRLEQRETQLNRTADVAQVTKWDAQSKAQLEILTTAANELKKIRAQWENQGGAKQKDLPQYITEPMTEWADAYAQAVMLSDMPDSAKALLAKGKQREQTFPIDMMQGILAACRAKLEQMRKSAATTEHNAMSGAEDLEANTKLEAKLRQELVEARETILKDPNKANDIVKKLFDEVQDLQDDTTVISTLNQISTLWQVMLDNYSAWGEMPSWLGGGKNDRYSAMQDRLTVERRKWLHLQLMYQSKSERKEARDELKKLSGQGEALQALLTEAGKLIQDEEKREAYIKIGLSILAAIAIGVVTAGVGSYVSGALLVGAGWGATTGGVIAATVVTAGAEALTLTTINTLLFEKNPTLGGFLTQFAENWALCGAMRAISIGAEAQAALRQTEAGAMAVKLTGQAINLTLMIGTSVLQADNEKRKTTGKGLTDAEMAQTAAQGFAVFLGTLLVSKYTGKLGMKLMLKGAESDWAKAMPSIGETNVKWQAAATLGLQLQAGGKTMAQAEAEANAGKALNFDRDAIQAELTSLKELDAFVKDPKNAANVAAMGLNAKGYGGAIDEAQNALNANERAQLSRMLEPDGGGLFRCKPEEFDAIADRYRKLGDQVDVKNDEQSGAKQMTVTPKEQGSSPMTIRSKVGNVDNKGTPPPDAPPAVTAPDVSNPQQAQNAQDIARWQTKGISEDAPDMWGKKASDGSLFKDWYAKWMASEERIVQDGDGFKAKYPEGCPPEFKVLFDGIVKKGNITLTTKAANTVDKLKAAGIDVSKLDPTSPEYLAQRPQIEKVLGKDGLAKFEETMFGKNAEKAAIDARMTKVLADGALDTLRAAFPDCEIVVTGSLTQTGKSINAVKDVDIILIVPECTKPEVRLGYEERAKSIKLPTGKDYQEGGGPHELSIDAKAMTKDMYMGMRSQETPAGRTPLNDVRIDSKVPTADEVAKKYGITDAGDIETFKKSYDKNPASASALAMACQHAPPGTFGKLVGAGAEGKVTPTGADMVNIAGELDVSTIKLATMDEATIKKLLHVSENINSPEVAKDVAAFEGNPNRLRFKSRLDKQVNALVDQVLGALGINKDSPDAAIFHNMNDGDRVRLWDLAAEMAQKGKSPELVKQAAKWALGKKPGSASEFVAQFHMYWAEAKQQANAIKASVLADIETQKAGGKSEKQAIADVTKKTLGKQLNSAKNDKADEAYLEAALKKMGVEVTTASGETTTQGAIDTDKAYQNNVNDLQNSNDGPGTRGLGQVADADLPGAVKAQIDTISFSSEAEAAYHAHKHRPEMANPDIAKTEMTDYLNGARQIVKDNGGSVTVNQDGSRNAMFQDQRGTVFVVVDKGGNASIATYMPNVKPKP
jgi:hypothetical protein